MSRNRTMTNNVDVILQRLASQPASADIDILSELVAAIRPRNPHDSAYAINTLRSLILLLSQRADLRRAFCDYLMAVLGNRRQLHLFAETGILSNEDVSAAFWRRLGEKILPSIYRDEYLKDALGCVFNVEGDEIWVHAVPDSIWLDVWQAMQLDKAEHAQPLRYIQTELIQAALVLSHRIAAIGLEPELVRNHPAIEQFESPFLTQNHSMREYLEGRNQVLIEPGTPAEDDLHVRVLLGQCEEIVQKVRKTAAQQGVSVSLTYLMVRLRQHLSRLTLLLDLLDPAQHSDVATRAVHLFKTLIAADRRKTSLRDLLTTNTDLIALQITEHAGRTGEHYIAGDRNEWLQMAKSAMGAGFIVGFMAMVKILMGKLVLAPLIQAAAFSLNYSLGFILIHTLHFTVATKQPAMTAAKIAASMEASGTDHDALDGLAELIETVCRTQFIAILGNVLIAMPTALLIALAIRYGTGGHWISPEKAHHLLADIDPLHSLAIPYAAIAGCCLFLAGLISGYYDNKAIYNQIPERLRQLKLPKRLLGVNRWHKVCGYIENNLGALAGNFFFGIMLGSAGTLGFVLGLPIDIRHITFSSANFAFALIALDFAVDGKTIALSLLGVTLIGLTNLAVSFGLALFVALRARRTTFAASRALFGKLLKRFFAMPWAFFYPPQTSPATSAAVAGAASR